MGSSSSRASAAAPSLPPSDVTSTALTIDTAVAAQNVIHGSGKQGKPRVSAASIPITNREKLKVQTKQLPPPVWDPRSPNVPRTPKKVVREIRASMIAQEKLAQALAELVNEEDRPNTRRNTTQLSSIPSVRNLKEKGRLAPVSSPKPVHPRIELDENPCESTKSTPTAAELTLPAPKSEPKPDSGIAVRIARPSTFGVPSDALSPLSRYVDTEFTKSCVSVPKAASGKRISQVEPLPLSQFATVECKEAK